MYKPNQQVGRVSSSFLPSWANEGRNIPTPGLSYYQLFPQSIEAALREADVVEKATKKRISTMKDIYSKMRKGNRRFKGGSTGDDDSSLDFDTDEEILGETFDAAMEQIEQTPEPQGREAPRPRGKFIGKRPPPGKGKVGAIRNAKRLREHQEVSEEDLKDYNRIFLEGQKAVRDRDKLKEHRENPRPGGKQPADRVIQSAQDKIDDLAEDYDQGRHEELLYFYSHNPKYKTADELEAMLGNNDETDLNKAKYLWMHWWYQKEARDKKDTGRKDLLGEPLDGAVVDKPYRFLQAHNLHKIITPSKKDIEKAIEGIRSDGGTGNRKRLGVFEVKQWHTK